MPALGLGVVAIAVVNPWIYWSAYFDFHIEAVATLFALLVARDLWTDGGALVVVGGGAAAVR